MGIAISVGVGICAGVSAGIGTVAVTGIGKRTTNWRNGHTSCSRMNFAGWLSAWATRSENLPAADRVHTTLVLADVDRFDRDILIEPVFVVD
mmetsp:Transcript_75510/g.213611  ORF Transcript_75510/g.213611 Transcript_75510/m.213611 type:complete len:92 (-) Transcript_75510:991-1266(-)